MTVISSRENPRVRRWRALVRDANVRRKERCVLIEGPNLVASCLEAGVHVREVVLGKSAATRPEVDLLVRKAGRTPIVLTDPIFRYVADTETPAGIAVEIAVPQEEKSMQGVPACVFLDSVQDSGNAGAILRSAWAFGIRHAVLGKGCADAWSAKVLRAAMGAHFSMNLRANADLDAAMDAFGGRIVCTVPRDGIPLSEADLSGNIAWLFGAEGNGVDPLFAERADIKVTIPMSGGAESLNVAAAAAICFYQFSRRAARD